MRVSRTWLHYQQTINGATLERRFQKVLTSKEVQKQFLYHHKLIHLISELYTDIDSAVVESAVIAHFLQYQYLFFFVNHKLLPFDIDSEWEVQRALQPLEEGAREIILNQFPNRSDNYHLSESFQILNEHIHLYHNVCSAKEVMDRHMFEEFIRPFAIVLHLPVLIFSQATGETSYNETLKKGLDYYFLGKKMITDIIDFKHDTRTNTWNYVQYTFDQKMKCEDVAIDKLSPEKKARYFFVSGVAADLYKDAISYFKQNAYCWDNLPSDRLKLFPEQEIIRLKQTVETIDLLIKRASSRIGVYAV